MAIGVGGHLLVNGLTTSLLTYIAHHNYPGGYAMDALHQLEPTSEGTAI